MILRTEFLVNTTTENAQRDPSIASLTDGGWVITWGSFHEGAAEGIYGQRYSDRGIAVGEEFHVNTFTTGQQDRPLVVALDDGGWLVIWWSQGQDGSNYGVYGQRFDNNGDPDPFGEFPVNTYTNDNQDHPSAAALADGGWIITWSSNGQDGSYTGVYGQRYDSQGIADPVGEFPINTYTHLYQTHPSTIGLDDGGWLVVWAGYGSSGSGIYSQRYDNNGVADPLGEIKVSTSFDGNIGIPSVITLIDGGWVVTWMGTDDSASGIFGQLYNSSGIPDPRGEFQVNTYTSGQQTHLDTAALSDGGWIVTWMSEDQDGSDIGIFGQRFDSNGVADPIGEFQVNTHTDSFQSVPSVAALPDGGWIITWFSNNQDGSSTGIFAQRYDAFGNPIPVVNTAPEGGVTVNGIAEEDQILTAKNDVADEDGLGLISYQWYVDGLAIDGATDDQLLLTQDHVSSEITVVASYTDGLGMLESVESIPTSPVANVNDDPAGTVSISGATEEGQTLTASNTLTDEDGLGVISYQWQLDEVDLEAATDDELLLTEDYVGSTVTVVASYIDAYGTLESKTSSATAPVTINASGSVIDGYVAGASIYIDANDNGVADPEEDTGVDTDANGNFEIDTVLQGSIIAVGGTNIDTGLPNNLILTAPEGSAVVTPITTLIDSFASEEGVSISEAEVQIQTALGIEDDIDLTQYDPLAEDTDTAVTVHAAAVQIATLGILADEAGSDFEEVVSALTTSASSGATLDLSDETYLEEMFGTVLGTEELALAVETNTALENAEDLTDITEVQQELSNTPPDGIIEIFGSVEADGQLGINNTLSDADGLGEFSYQWLLDGSAIENASGEFFTLDSSQSKQKISVQVSYTDGGGTLESVTSSYVTAPIYDLISDQTNDTVIQAAYVAFYGRPADPGGLVAWSDALGSNGGNLSSVIDAFGNSTEFNERYGHLTNRELVNEIYIQCFNRPAEEIGLNAWTAFLDDGVMTLQNIALEILMGARNKDAISIINKIGFAEDFTESVALGIAEYNGAEQANAIKEILLNVSHESRDSDFAALISSYASLYAPKSGFISRDATFSFEKQFDILPKNAENRLPEMWDMVDINDKELESDPATDEPTGPHEEYVQHLLDSGDLLLI
ncbi:DUF4214 domain-containing protein [Neptuniibacter sp.]|uniref:DUF4214 domain-containing protein n=1 Tax=Neptuniibacter sp. TaxID=1962643 RepID=UPI002632BC3D|nr:DUF4214 domain-containing protein [Neptuniibacter sp.]MCP4597245.1 DUF4214 domain-containing protein [Neptuniibacter sp.]